MLETLSEHKTFDGVTGYYQHQSDVNRCNMKFAVFVPHHSPGTRLPVLTYLSGLTCTEETFMIKAGAQQHAARHGIMLVAPDTSPRGDDVPDDEAWDFAQGAGFYLDATQEPWNTNFNMYSYVTKELPEIVGQAFPADQNRQGIFGHSMGGHGALTIALKNPQQYKSVSAFAPICAPMQCPWGKKAFQNYLGDDEVAWQQHDASRLVADIAIASQFPEILVDQGMNDPFLEEQLHPKLLESAAREAGLNLKLRFQDGYDHGYFFIQSFVADHLQHHAGYLHES